MDRHEQNCGLCHIALENVGVVRDRQEILQRVTMHIHCGQLTALIGQNGAGKTTLLKALMREIPFTGKIRHEDHHGRDIPHLRTGYVPQHLDFDREMPATVQDFLASALTNKPVWLGIGKDTKKRVYEALASVKAEELLLSPLGKLSGGELQRVLLALALTPAPDLLVLDEPVSGVDQNGLALFLNTVLELRAMHHMAILLVSHDLSLVEKYADYVVLLDRQVLCAGSPGDVFSSPEFKRVFQTPRTKEQLDAEVAL